MMNENQEIELSDLKDTDDQVQAGDQMMKLYKMYIENYLNIRRGHTKKTRTTRVNLWNLTNIIMKVFLVLMNF